MKLSDVAGITCERLDQLHAQLIGTAFTCDTTTTLFQKMFEFAETLPSNEAMAVGYLLADMYNQIAEMENE